MGKVEHGRSRILEDIQGCKLRGWKVLMVNMKGHKYSYQGLINYLTDQMKFNNLTPKPKDLTDWVNQVVAKRKKVCLLLDNFDALLGDVEIDAPYRNQQFVYQLNAFSNHSHIVLLCATTETHLSSHFYIGTKQCSSPFILQKESMPTALAYEKIKDDLDRKLKENEYWENVKDEKNGGQYIAVIHKHKEPYLFLVYVAERIQLQSNDIKRLPIAEKLKLWRKSFKELEYKEVDAIIAKKMNGAKRFLTNVGVLKPKGQKPISSSASTSSMPSWWLILLSVLAAIFGDFESLFGNFWKVFWGMIQK